MMNRRSTRIDRFETLHHDRDSVLSLSSLNTLLAKAQKDLPAHVVPQPDDAGEELASQLIAKVRQQFKRSHPAHWLGASLRFRSEEMAGPDVR
jgi:hypothetical protein